MFGNRAIRLQVVRTADTPQLEPREIDLDKINQVLKDQVTHAAFAIVTVYAAYVGLNTASEVIINAAPKRH